MRAFYLGSVLLLAAGSVACDNQALDFVVGPGQPQTIQASAISLSASAPMLSVGQSVQLTAVVLDGTGNPISNPTVKWTSSNASIATVSATGLVAAVALGTATVTATSGNVSKDATVAVTATAPQTPPDPTSGSVALPALLNTDMPAAPSAGGTIISVAANGDLQAAINAAKPGDVIELARGATYTGVFTLPNKGASTSWIVIRPAAGAALPPEGQRMTPALAASLALPKIVSPDYQAALATKLGAHHYRLVGLEITVAPAQTFNYGLVLFGASNAEEGQTTMASIAHDLVLDRVYIHGTDVVSLKRCVALNSAATAIIDSWLSACHAEGQDAQAIGGWNGPGPFKIVNNYLEGAAENILFGGADPSIPNLVPSDIEIRRNHISKPTSWHGGRWLIKNLLELKNAQRVLVEGNVFENNWQNGQEGAGIVMWSVNQSGSATWDVMQDITFRKNVIRNVGAGFQIAATSGYVSIPTQRMSITDNLVYGINQPGFEGNGRGFQIGGGVASLMDLTIVHNTVIGSTATAFTLTGNASQRLTITDNILSGGYYGIIGDGTGVGTPALDAFAPGATFSRNVLVLPSDYVSQFPSGNSYPASLAAIGFVNSSSSDYHLSPASPFKASTGRDPGADIDAVQTAVSGVVLP
jgi:hypothetical protein